VSARAGRSRRRAPRGDCGWDRVAGWYDGWVGQRGSRYHRALAIPALLDLLRPQPGEAILDVGAGQGVLAPYLLGEGVRYTGVDASPRLISIARRRHGAGARFFVGDARELDRLPGVAGQRFDAAVFLLSVQDMDPLDAVLRSVASVCASEARIVLVMTHPAFRQPRHSGWGYDPSRKLAYRRADAYLSPMSVPMKSVAGCAPTRSHHRPIGGYINGLATVGFTVDAMTELPDLPGSQRRSSRRPSVQPDVPLGIPPGVPPTPAMGSQEIPLLLGLRAVRRAPPRLLNPRGPERSARHRVRPGEPRSAAERLTGVSTGPATR